MTETCKGVAGWGSPEVRVFFDEATRAHFETGIYTAYNRALDDLVKDYSPQEAYDSLEAARAELPLGVTEGFGIEDDDGEPIGAGYALEKIDPTDGSYLTYSIIWFANVEHGQVVSKNRFFTDEQVALLVLQALRQDELGIRP